jgi:hypothetical protein
MSPVNLSKQYCQQSGTRKLVGIWPDILRFEPKWLHSGDDFLSNINIL